MTTFIALVGAAIAVVYCLTLLLSFSGNLAAARASGLPYTIVPVYVLHLPWQIGQRLFIPIISLLPSTWTDSWLPWLDLNHLWMRGYEPFRYMNADVFIAVSPQRNVLWTCSAEANHQITARRLDFTKPTEVYGPLNTFGPTLPAVEGEEWRSLRKVTGRAFHENTNHTVWAYTQNRVQMLINDWTSSSQAVISHVHEELARVTLHVISRVCFQRDIASKETIPPNHQLSYGMALSAVFAYLPICFLTPSWLLHRLPFPLFRTASLALAEWKAYIEEMRQETMKELEDSSTVSPDYNLLTSLVQACSSGTISHEALNGNIFVFHAAGYETSGGTLGFALLMLACFPSAQEKLHAELDSLLHSNPTILSELSYKEHFAPLLDGYTGAVLAETLRLFPVLSWLPKCTLSPQILTLNNKRYTVPANTLVIIATDATHRNPKSWSKWPLNISNPKTGANLHSFTPESWLDNNAKFQPTPGSYMAYSAGSRSCIAQRFAQVEMCAALATLFRDHRIELALPHSRLKTAKAEERDWNRARDSVLRTLERTVYFELTLKMPVKIPLRLVRRTTN